MPLWRQFVTRLAGARESDPDSDYKFAKEGGPDLIPYLSPFRVFRIWRNSVSHNSFGFDTLAIRSGHRRTPELEHSEAIFATSSFVFENAAQAAARFAGDQPGNIYSRFTNPHHAGI